MRKVCALRDLRRWRATACGGRPWHAAGSQRTVDVESACRARDSSLGMICSYDPGGTLLPYKGRLWIISM